MYDQSPPSLPINTLLYILTKPLPPQLAPTKNTNASVIFSVASSPYQRPPRMPSTTPTTASASPPNNTWRPPTRPPPSASNPSKRPRRASRTTATVLR